MHFLGGISRSILSERERNKWRRAQFAELVREEGVLSETAVAASTSVSSVLVFEEVEGPDVVSNRCELTLAL